MSRIHRPAAPIEIERRAAGATAGRSSPFAVLIAGGGFAALEAALALRALAGEEVSLTFVAPEPIVRYRPAATVELFEPAPPRAYDLRAVAGHLDARIHAARLESVASTVREVRLSSGARISYDALVLAIGARAHASIPGARIFRDQRDVPALRGVLAGIGTGAITRLVLAVPSGSSWPLPLYEVALLAAREADRRSVDVGVSLVTPEFEPLEIFGPRASRSIARLLEERGVRYIGGCTPTGVRRDGGLELAADGVIPADQVITIPQLGAHRITGIPASWWGFVPTDRDGRVQGLEDVYAAGDMTAFPVKQGGLAAQHADRIANAIARRLGVPVLEPDGRLVLQAQLVGGPGPLVLRTELDWLGRPTAAAGDHLEQPAESSASKVLGRYLAPYLEHLEAIPA